MRRLIIVAALALASCTREYRVEWSEDYRTGSPCEITFSARKMKGADWTVLADGNAIKTAALDNGRKGEVTLRFEVPEGVKSLSLRKAPKTGIVSSEDVDNLFSGAQWVPDPHTSVDGQVLRSTDFEVGYVRKSVEIEKGGFPVRAEIDVKGLAKVTFPVKISFRQYDADGNEIPDDVCDARWTSGFVPWFNAGDPVVSKFRTSGRVHPLARRIEALVEFHPCPNDFGRDGLKVEDPSDNLPVLEISRLAMRPAASLPFPHYDDSFFAPGVSGNALAFDGTLGFWFNTRTSGNWAKGAQFRDPASFNYPDGDGTVEAWFLPDWYEDADLFIPLFEASQHNSLGSEYGRYTIGKCLDLSYNAQKGILRLKMKDPMRKQYGTEVPLAIGKGEWHHVAVAFSPGSKAEVFLDGRSVLQMPLEGWTFVDNAREFIVNDRYPMEFYLGSSYVNTRAGGRSSKVCAKWPGALDPSFRGTRVPETTDTLYRGLFDQLRISRTVRYSEDFTPAAAYAYDSLVCASFDFERCFDGRSAGTSLGFIAGSVFSPRPINVHRLGNVQYYPESIAPEVDPMLLVKKGNFDVVPSEEDFRSARKVESRSFSLKPGDKFILDAPEGVLTDYIEIENTGTETLEYPIVLGKGDVDPRSYEDIRRTLGLEGLSPREKADKILRFANANTDYYMNYPAYFAPDSDEAVPLAGNTPGTWGAHFSGSQALIHLGAYVGFECGPLNRIASALYSNVGDFPAEECCGYGHEFQQIFFDGKWHIYDQSSQTYFLSKDFETPASLEEFDREPDTPERTGRHSGPYIRLGYRTIDANTVFYHEKLAATLRPGEKVRLWTCNDGNAIDIHTQRKLVENDMIPRWDIGNYEFYDYADSCFAYGNDPIYRIDRLFPEYSNGFLEWSGRPTADNPAFERVEEGSFCFRMRSPLPVVSAVYRALDASGKELPMEISTDGGKTFRPFVSPATYAVRCRMAYYIRVKADISAVERFEARTEFVANPRLFPGRLHEGRNSLSLIAENEGSARVTVQYRYPSKEIVFEGALDHGTLPGYEHSTVFMDPTRGILEVPVSGLSQEASLGEISGGLTAELAGGVLRLSSERKDAFIGWVTVTDEGAEKTLSVASIPGCRVIRPSKTFFAKGDSLHIDFEPVPAGEYSLLHLDRFPSFAPGVRTKAVDVRFGDYSQNALRDGNVACDFLKQKYGPERKGERGRWKWEYLIDYRFEFPYYGMKSVTLEKPCGSLDYNFIANAEAGPVELEAVIVLPAPSRDFNAELYKNLCSINNRPWGM